MTDSTALDRELRLLAGVARPAADVAGDALLVDERGVQRLRDASPARVPDPRIDGLSTLALSERVVLVAYRLLAADGTAACCSTVWRHDPGGWVAVLHQRSPGSGAS